MATTRATGQESQNSPVDDEFLQHLYRGGELLAAGKVIEAKDVLERAHKMQPRNEKGQNLLGLTYFKLGMFDRAAELYEMLVRENPVDPTLRINLGLVYLKTNALQRAVREFEVAVDLSPDHQKAHNYLGLALAQAGEYGRAREHFIKSGSDAMAEKMSRAIAGDGFSRPAPVQPARARGFSELEGAEVVREQGGEPVPESPRADSEPTLDMVEEAPSQQEQVHAAEPVAPTPPPLPPSVRAPEPRQAPPPAEDDWGAQFGLDDSAQTQAPAPAEQPLMEAEPEVVSEMSTGGMESPAAEAALSGAEGPVMVVTAPPAAPAEELSITVEEVPVPAPVEAAAAPPYSEENLPVLPVEEVSEDGMPVLTAEPEDPEDLAAMAQHEQAPPLEAPVEAAPEAPYYPEQAPAEAPPPEAPYFHEQASAEAAPPEVPVEPAPEAAYYPEASAVLAPSEPAAGFQAEAAPEEAPAPMEAGEGETPAAIPAVFNAVFPPQSASLALPESNLPQEGASPPLGELAPTIMLEGANPTSRFTVGAGGFSAVVDGELLTRLEGLVAFSGQLSFQPEMKRFRGRTTDKPFGDEGLRMVRASGRGMLFIEPAERRAFHVVDLGEESAYFRDECVFAFEEPVMFENGRVPSDVAPDLDLVHLRGNGKVLLCLTGPLRSLPVGMEAPVTVPLTHLVGWQGNLTPRVVSLLWGPAGEILKTGVELSGEGFALMSLPVR
ncbi:tetratricopeptide repeat protein [Hyalangium rubrum]|uniref:Tetratricopeptide repeat protein n=1 Tax=Hyalangium rubrum TaxID=3103134 RepID=A0ABU5H9G3_9BACT|nr:tetratricopeptide repeat protein [Hyalangium sp. s54d21]MDY7229468.1 tetratricopeptide repeat protein [Hyalangium sp. s54d21]